MITFQDLEQAENLETFLQDTINKFLASPQFRQYTKEERYFKGENPFLDKREYTIILDTGEPFTLKPIVNISSNFYRRIVEQLVNRLWYNPVQFEGKDRTGDSFDETAQKIAVDASKHGVGFGFWNVNQLVHFTPLEFIPLYDERTNELMAGIRFWRVDPKKPRYIQLYTVEGLREWIEVDNGPMTQITPLTSYRHNRYSGTIEYTEDKGGYGRLPIVPLHTNSDRISELTAPIESKIDAYDLLQTSKLDDFATTRPIYWRIEGFQGEIGKLLELRDTLDSLGLITVEETNDNGNPGIGAEVVNLNYEQTKEFLSDLENSIFRDAQVINTEAIVEGDITATAVKFSSSAEDSKVKSMEQYATKFLVGILDLMGLPANTIEFTHKRVTNDFEITQILQMHHGMGVPIDLLLEESPIAQGKLEEWRQFIQTHALGMDDYGQNN